jgi:hypothetical protein
MAVDEKSAQELLALDLDDLYAELGDLLLLSEAGIEGEDFAGVKDAIWRARIWIQRKLEEIQEAVCDEDVWPVYREKLESGGIEAAVLFIDTCLEEHFRGFPVLTLSTLLVKEGLDRVCATR